MPKRIQRKRTKGWRMPAGAVYVGRPTKWGNPYDWKKMGRKESLNRYRGCMAYAQFSTRMAKEDTPTDIIRKELGGKDLACWCPLDQPCHADVLLEIANG